MTQQMDFDYSTGKITYPKAPGWKGKPTSKAAARKIAPEMYAIRKEVEAWFRAGNRGSGEECALAIGYEKYTVRSRCSELAKQGVIEDTGTTSISKHTGKAAVVWKIKQ